MCYIIINVLFLLAELLHHPTLWQPHIFFHQLYKGIEEVWLHTTAKVKVIQYILRTYDHSNILQLKTIKKKKGTQPL